MNVPAGMENNWNSEEEEDVYSLSHGKGEGMNSHVHPGGDGGDSVPVVDKNDTQERSSNNYSEQRLFETRPRIHRSRSVDDLRLAVMQGNLDSVKELINEGIFVDSVLKAGWTALMYACSFGHHKIVAFLLENKADPNFHKDLFTPLMAACASRKENEENLLKCIEYLLEAGAKVNVKERHHMTPLLFACREGRSSIVRKLIENGAEVDRRDNRGWTSLAWASSGGYGEIVRMLLDAKADSSILSLTGQSAADVAYAQGYTQIGEIIEQYGNRNVNGQNEMNSPGVSKDASKEKYGRKLLYFGDLEIFLVGIGFENLIPNFHDNDLSFKDLFQMNEQELEKIGIKESNDRKKILREVQALNKIKSEKPDLPELEYRKFLSCEDAVTMMTNISRHLAYIGGTIVYLRQQIQAHPRLLELSQQPFNVNSLIKEAEQSVRNARLLYEELRFLAMHLNKVQDNDNYIPADIITETARLPKSTKWGLTLKVFLLISLSTLSVTLGSVWWKNPQSISRFLILPNIVKKFIN